MAGTAALMQADAATPFRAVFYLCMWSVLSCYLAYFAWRLQHARMYRHALGVGLVALAAETVAVMYDFYSFPGDEEHLVFYSVAAPVWSLLCAEMYYAYCALERSMPVREDDDVDDMARLF